MIYLDEKINVNNKEHFSEIRFVYYLERLKTEIYEFVLNDEENEFFDLCKFFKDKKLSEEQREEMCKDIRVELGNLGWNTKLVYGKTGLYIYSTKSHISDDFEEI